jgi:hypothetical protein
LTNALRSSGRSAGIAGATTSSAASAMSPARSRTFGLLPHGTVCASSTDGGDLVRALTLNKEPHE